MRKKEHFTPDYTKHYVLQEIGMIKGYKLVNETTETEGLIMNHIHMVTSKNPYEKEEKSDIIRI